MELDPEKLENIAERWKKAAYPSLVTDADSAVEDSSDSDAQLARALKLIREKLSPQTVPIAA